MNTWLAILFLIIASTATAATNPNAQHSLTGTQIAKDARKGIPVCQDGYMTTLRVIAAIGEDGKIVPMGVVMISEAC